MALLEDFSARVGSIPLYVWRWKGGLCVLSLGFLRHVSGETGACYKFRLCTSLGILSGPLQMRSERTVLRHHPNSAPKRLRALLDGDTQLSDCFHRRRTAMLNPIWARALVLGPSGA